MPSRLTRCASWCSVTQSLYTAVIGLTKDSIRHYGVKVYPEAALGCDLDLAPSRLGGVVYQGQPGVNCGSWQSDWRHDVRKVHPEVAGLLIGRFELADHFYGGSWVHVGQPGWDRHLSLELDQAVTILSAGGARVALFTFPYIDPPLEQPNGSIYPENDPAVGQRLEPAGAPGGGPACEVGHPDRPQPDARSQRSLRHDGRPRRDALAGRWHPHLDRGWGMVAAAACCRSWASWGSGCVWADDERALSGPAEELRRRVNGARTRGVVAPGVQGQDKRALSTEADVVVCHLAGVPR